MNESRNGPRTGFTLVELLMVILIISMLIALLLPAVNAARVRGIETAISVQIEQLGNGLEDFKSTYGAYPPSMVANPNAPYWTDQEVMSFLRRAWPKATFTIDDVRIIQSLDAAESLVFWLGGIPDIYGKPRGFCSDPRHPLKGPEAGPDSFDPFNKGTSAARTQPFQFDETRLFDKDRVLNPPDGDRFCEYYPPNARPEDSGPFVYFAARTNKVYYLASPPSANAKTLPSYVDPRSGVAPGVAVPYSFVAAGRFVKPDGFQVISAGIDNEYGSYGPNIERIFPAGDFGGGGSDNLTSFCRGRLGDAQP